MARELTAKQNNFIDGVVSGLSYAQAYRQAGYATKGMSIETLAKEASRLAARPHISPLIAQRQKELANKAIWDREQALKMLKNIADEAVKEEFRADTRSVAIKAIEQANKMCGYNEPEKQEITHNGVIKVIISDE